MQTRYIVGGVIALVVIGVGYYGISPLFRNIKVDEALPGQGDAMHTDESMMHNTTTSEMMDKEEAGEAMMHASDTPVEIMGTPAHPASGTVRIVQADGKNYVRYENFKTINGPDIYVYLSKDQDAHDFVNLGKVKATEGNINYEIPADVDPSQYSYVLTWCKTFGVLFNYARIR